MAHRESKCDGPLSGLHPLPAMQVAHRRVVPVDGEGSQGTCRELRGTLQESWRSVHSSSLTPPLISASSLMATVCALELFILSLL